MRDLYAKARWRRRILGYIGNNCDACPGAVACIVAFDAAVVSGAYPFLFRKAFPCGLTPDAVRQELKFRFRRRGPDGELTYS